MLGALSLAGCGSITRHQAAFNPNVLKAERAPEMYRTHSPSLRRGLTLDLALPRPFHWKAELEAAVVSSGCRPSGSRLSRSRDSFLWCWSIGGNGYKH